MTDIGLMARKSVRDIIASGEAEGHNLAKALGPVSITAMGIGAIIGAGIFVLTGTAAAHYAGPGIMLSFVLGGVACAFVERIRRVANLRQAPSGSRRGRVSSRLRARITR